MAWRAMGRRTLQVLITTPHPLGPTFLTMAWRAMWAGDACGTRCGTRNRAEYLRNATTDVTRVCQTGREMDTTRHNGQWTMQITIAARARTTRKRRRPRAERFVDKCVYV